MWPIILSILSLLVAYTLHWTHRWRNPKCSGTLPPGSMGFPIIGETYKFFTPYTSGVSPFIAERVKRYGALFRTSLVGYPIVVSTDPEMSHYIFQQEGRLFQCWYMDTFTELFGLNNISDIDYFVHKYLRTLISTLFGPENLKLKLLPEMEQNVRSYLQLWTGRDSVELKDSISAMIFYFTAKKMINYDEEKSREKLRENFVDFMQGLISFPINIPGTAYYKCSQGRKKAVKFLKRTLDEKRASSEKGQCGFLDLLIEEMTKEDPVLTEAFALDLIFFLLFASYETTSSALTLGMKLLAEHPLVLEELTKEQELILRNRECDGAGLSWKEYKSMTFTFMVINEILRLANVAPGIFRKTMKDVILMCTNDNCNTAEYTIPKGWAVMVCPPAVHLNPKSYDDPQTFNPWRWEGRESTGGLRDFVAFGGGLRYCVGSDMAKLQMAVFLHCVVTKYRWKIVKGGTIRRTPGLLFPDGIHIQLRERA